jgi:enterobacterial common antigen flippase
VLPLIRLFVRIAQARGGALGMLQTLIAQIGILAVNVGTGVVTARLLGPVGRGEFAAATMWFMLPSLLATAGLQSGLAYQTRRTPGEAGSIGAAGMLVAIAIFVPAALLCLTLLPYLMHDYSPTVVTLARVMTAASALNILMLLARQSLLGTRNMHVFNISSAASPIVYFLLLLAVLPFHALDPAIALMAQVAATVVVLLPTMWWASRDWRWRHLRPFAALRSLARYSWRAAGVDLATIFYWHIDKIVLIKLISPMEFGLYAVATSFARMIGVLQAAASSVTLADLAHRPAPEIEAYIHRTVRLLFWLLLMACAIGWLIGHMMLRLVYGDSFASAVPIFRVMLVEGSASCIAQVLLEAFLASGTPTYPATVQGIYCVLLFSALLLLAPLWGGLGAATAMLLAAAGKIVMLLSGLRRIGVAWPRLVPNRNDLVMVRQLWHGATPTAPGQ